MDKPYNSGDTYSKELWKALAVTTSTPAMWGPIEDYCNYTVLRAQAQLETCSANELAPLQGEIKALRTLLSLRDKATRELRYITNK